MEKLNIRFVCWPKRKYPAVLMLVLISRKSLETIIVCNDDRDSHVPVAGLAREPRSALHCSFRWEDLTQDISCHFPLTKIYGSRDWKSDTQMQFYANVIKVNVAPMQQLLLYNNNNNKNYKVWHFSSHLISFLNSVLSRYQLK